MSTFLHDARSTFPVLSKLYAICLCIPVTSVNCERGISTYNNIKTDERNSMKVSTANMLMCLNLEGPPISTFNFDEAFEKWATTKGRRSAATRGPGM